MNSLDAETSYFNIDGSLSILGIMDSPVDHAEISQEALEVLYQEASIAASEIVGPNSIEWSAVQEDKFEELQSKFWIRFITQYHDLRVQGKI